MLWNTFHKLILFHHIQFQVLVLTVTPNLKLNAPATATTFQIICNSQKRNKTIMDMKNVSKPDHKVQRNQRFPRSCSSPSNRRNIGVVEPQRTQSQLVFGGNMEPNFGQSYPPHDFRGNPVFNGQFNGFYNMQQQPWNYHFQGGQNCYYTEPYACSVPSSSGFNNQYQGNQYTTLEHPRPYKKKNKVPDRKWEPEKPIHNKLKKFVFTLMSYNVLAQDLVENHEYLYKDHNKDALKWQVRWVNILKEIGDTNPDIICFQEVQESHIDGYFDILEKKLGYKSIYKKRTGIRTDGCAIYYKRKRLQLMEYEKVEYFQEDVPVLNRDNIAIVARFVPKETHTQAFVVATTHLLYNPKRQDVRLAQIQNLIAEVDKMAFLGTNNDGSHSYLPIILTGDLNSTPNSAVYEFISRGVLDYENLSKRTLTKEIGRELTGKVLVPKSLQMTDNCQFAEVVEQRNEVIKTCEPDRGEGSLGTCHQGHQEISFSSGTLSHPFSLKSVYNHISNNDVEGTTHQDEWITVDYIFYSEQNKKIDGKNKQGSVLEGKLKQLTKYQLLTKRQLNGMKIPNAKLGSDHFSLIVKFSLE